MVPESKEEAAKQAYEKAKKYTPQYQGWSCGTLLALQDIFDKRDENVFKASSGLHGGVGGMRDVCGSLLGASMMMGLMYGCGTGETDNPKQKEVPTQMTSQLYKWIKKEFGSVKCRTVNAKFQKEVNDDINTRGLAEPDKQARVFAKCDNLCGKIAARTAELLWDAIEAEKKK